MAQNSKANLTTQPPARSLFFFSLPMIIGNLFQQFYNMADSIIVGQLVGESLRQWGRRTRLQPYLS